MSLFHASVVAYAILLSLACLAWGAVHDAMVAALLALSLPLLGIMILRAVHVHPGLIRWAAVLLCTTALVILLQILLPPLGESAVLWRDAEQILEMDPGATAALDRGRWFEGVGRFLLWAIAIPAAILIGSHPRAARLFLRALLMSGGVLVAGTFFLKTSDILYANRAYAHGFVNPNNAATYLGIMLLLVIAESWHFIRHVPDKRSKTLPELIDSLSLDTILRALLLLFACLLFIAGLLMTGSRGGIILALIAGASLIFILLSKSVHYGRKHRRLLQAGLAMVGLVAAAFAWSYTHFGDDFTRSLAREGFTPHDRPEILAAGLPIAVDHALLGTGLGSFPSIFPAYRPDTFSSEGWIDKAHNSYLEVAIELGIPGALLLAAALGILGFHLVHGVRRRKKRYVEPALGLCVFGFVAAHSAIDFPIQIPALALVALSIVTVCACQADKRFCHPEPSSKSKP